MCQSGYTGNCKPYNFITWISVLFAKIFVLCIAFSVEASKEETESKIGRLDSALLDVYRLQPGDEVIFYFASLQNDTISYKICIGDRIDIRFVNNPDLNTEQNVRSDGMISLPYIGEIFVVGYTVENLRQMLINRYEHEISSPNIYIVIVSSGCPEAALKQWSDRLLIANNRSVTIAPDGTISIPYCTVLNIQGKTITEAAHAVKNACNECGIFVDVSCQLIRAVGMSYCVLGSVNRPGWFNITRRLTLAEAIAMAGGSTTEANNKSIYILRAASNNSSNIQKVNFMDLLNGKGYEKVETIGPGDVVYVPRRGIANAAQTARYLWDIIFFRGMTIDIGRFLE